MTELAVIPVFSTVIATTPNGPILEGRHAPRRPSSRGVFVNILSTPQRVVVAILTAAWIASFVAFWAWWLQPQHVIDPAAMIVNSAMLFYVAYLPLYFLVAVNRLREVDPDLDVPDLRVAFVVTKAPSEPWDTARTTLGAMLSQRYPHDYDVWLCDETPTEAVALWCMENNVALCSRFGVEEYHNAQWPRRTKCKEGNLAYFYDTVGYRDYDVVAQLDCDHVPAPGYLAEMVRPFVDPAMGYVAAPSVCDSNASASWSARGRLYREASFHGPVQTGHSDGLAPVSIGSHYAVRTQALWTIGGVGPELAEDFSTSFLLNSGGWHGAFASRAEAHGDGPLTFSAMVTQEFQWSRSLFVLLTETAPRHLGRLPMRLRLRFLFALSFNPLLAIMTLIGLSLPVIAAVTGMAWVHVNYLEFLLRWCAMGLCLVVLTLFLRSWGLLRPVSAPVVSWENWLYALSRWPFIAQGVFAAIVQKFRPTKAITFRVTPKERDGFEPLAVRLVIPFIVISLVLSGAAIVAELTRFANGYVLLCLLGALSYAVVALAIPLLHAHESARASGAPFLTALQQTAAAPLALGIAVWVPFTAAVIPFPTYFAPLIWSGSFLLF
ncbi:MAG: glycosyltransferase [Glaciihabitans sp.]|nr:glycosyltransferase [Glaciihabitans sp.]